MKTFLVFLLAVCLASQAYKTYDGYKVYSVEPTREQADLIHNFSKEKELDFWTPLRKDGHPVSIMVEPDIQESFVELLNANGIKYSIPFENVASYIERERIQQAARRSTRGITYDRYPTVEEIDEHIEQLARDHPDILSLENIGRSFEGREMNIVKISTSPSSSDKPVILIDAAIHAREWITPVSAVYIIDQLVLESNRDLIENVDWYILPVLNPDGYAYSHTDDRLWRKTRTPGISTSCYGVDGNRNFDYFWAHTGSSPFECTEDFHGPYPFSEVELQNLRDFSQANADRIKLYLNVHSHGRLILYPWGYTSDLPDNADELQYLGELVAAEMEKISGTRWLVGSSTNVLYAAAGGADDWMKGGNGVALSYCVELQTGPYHWGFGIEHDQILPSVQEFFAGIRVYHSYIEAKYANK